jgi:hypothetical protein
LNLGWFNISSMTPYMTAVAERLTPASPRGVATMPWFSVRARTHLPRQCHRRYRPQSRGGGTFLVRSWPSTIFSSASSNGGYATNRTSPRGQFAGLSYLGVRRPPSQVYVLCHRRVSVSQVVSVLSGRECSVVQSRRDCLRRCATRPNQTRARLNTRRRSAAVTSPKCKGNLAICQQVQMRHGDRKVRGSSPLAGSAVEP